jgi:hypothetical protein
MRCKNDVLELAQRPVVRLLRKHVQSGTCETTGPQRLDEGALIDHATASDVHEQSAAFHRRELGCTQRERPLR